jgi:hypothetical protein
VLHRAFVVVSAQVETARQQWVEGHRRYREASSDPVRFDLLTAQMQAVVQELRRRLGQVFTIQELADEYGRAERWSRDVELGAAGLRPGDLVTAEDAAFHLYARGARDFEP